MLKYSLTCISILLLFNLAKAEDNDTVTIFYKFGIYRPIKVQTVDSADFIRKTYPSAIKGVFEIREYYNTGIRKFIGQINQEYHSLTVLNGDCISYFPNGKRQNAVHYDNGKKSGLEYNYKSNGQLMSVLKWVLVYGQLNFIDNYALNWDFFDNNGNQLCKEGNGRWIAYHNDYNTNIDSGYIKQGFKYGQWKGFVVLDDTIRYIVNYKKSVLSSGIGYDKKGVEYPFSKTLEGVAYKGGNMFGFVSDLNSHLKVPINTDGKKMKLDTIHISFVIEKDGTISHLEPLGNNFTDLKNALNKSIVYCKGWTPVRYYGVPFRSKLIMSLKINNDYTSGKGLDIQTINLKGEVLDFIKPGQTYTDPF